VPRLSALLLLLALSGASATHARATYATNAVRSAAPAEISSNWSGYVVASADPSVTTTFSDVTGTWVQPKVTCTAGRSDAVAFWVGLGGNARSSQALEQLGTEAECDGISKTPRYGVWWEIIPSPSVPIRMKLTPGDRITAAVLVNGTRVTMSLKNLTRGTRFSKTITVSQVDTASAEWIVEAPSSCSVVGTCRVVPLSRFGTVTFANAATIGDGVPDTLASPTWALTPITLITGTSDGGFFGDQTAVAPGVGAVPGAITADGRGFSVSWSPNVTPGT
jgi:Peptidase A4 family